MFISHRRILWDLIFWWQPLETLSWWFGLKICPNRKRGVFWGALLIKNARPLFLEDERNTRGTTSVHPGLHRNLLRVSHDTLCCNGHSRRDLTFAQPRCSGAIFPRPRLPPLTVWRLSVRWLSRGTLSFIAFPNVSGFRYYRECLPNCQEPKKWFGRILFFKTYWQILSPSL